MTAPLFPHTLAPDQWVDERYQIESLLGRGGMGIVYRAIDSQTGERVAIKTIIGGARASVAKRFRREFRVLTRLSHVNIVAVHDWGQIDALPYYVMEFIQGSDLHQLLAHQHEQISLAATISIGIQIGQALAYIHNQGIVHRDVKPSNIMVIRTESPGTGAEGLVAKLMDFGLVKTTDISAHITTSGALVGTLKYLAPEQMKGLMVDRRADLYSLGLVLFELATGGFPFGSGGGLEIAFQRLTRPPTSPLAFKPDLSPKFSSCVLKLLQAQADARYPSAEALLSDLVQLSGDSTAVRAPSLKRADVLLQASFTGRDRELARLQDEWENAWNGHSRFTLVEGEAGVGKSRLLQELLGRIRQAGGHCFQGTFFEEEQLAYGPFRKIIEGAINCGHAIQMDGLEAEIIRLIPSLDATAAGFALLDPDQAQLRFYEAITQYLLRIARTQPLALFLDDLQWADQASLELLHYLVRSVQKTPMFIVGTARHEELDVDHPLTVLLQGMSRHDLVLKLSLKPLSPKEARELVGLLLPGEHPPTEIADLLHREAEGNPFFIEEMLKAWIEEERIAWKSGSWRLCPEETITGGESLTLPGSIIDIIGRRLRGLESQSAKALNFAAVLGREFNFDILLHMDPLGGEDRLLDAIDELLRSRLLDEIDHPQEDRYHFAHKKIQEVIYSRMNKRRRCRLHQKAGEAFETIYSEHPKKVIQSLARHFLNAADPKGIRYGYQAGNAAKAVYANREALAFYDQALQLAFRLDHSRNKAPSELMCSLHTNAAEVNRILGNFQIAVDHLIVVLDLLPESDQSGQRASIHRRLAGLYEEQGLYKQSIKASETALQLSGPAPSLELALIYQGKAWVQRRQGDLVGAIAQCKRGLDAVPTANSHVWADLHDTLGVIYRDLGDFDRALSLHKQSLLVREQLEDQPGIAKTCNNMAASYWRQGNYQNAITFYQQSLAICQRIEHSTGLASVYNNLGLIYDEQGNHEKAILSYQKALEIFERTGNNLGVALTSGNLGEAHRNHGELVLASEYLQSALQISEEMGDLDGIRYAFQMLAWVYLEQESLALSLEAGKKALEIAVLINAPPQLAESHQVLGEILIRQGNKVAAKIHLENAHDLFSDLGDRARTERIFQILQQIEPV